MACHDGNRWRIYSFPPQHGSCDAGFSWRPVVAAFCIYGMPARNGNCEKGREKPCAVV